MAADNASRSRSSISSQFDVVVGRSSTSSDIDCPDLDKVDVSAVVAGEVVGDHVGSHKHGRVLKVFIHEGQSVDEAILSERRGNRSRIANAARGFTDC